MSIIVVYILYSMYNNNNNDNKCGAIVCTICAYVYTQQDTYANLPSHRQTGWTEQERTAYNTSCDT